MTLVVLDPGHGKETAGKRSPDGSLMEYEFNRDVARRLKKYLNNHDVNVLLTCEGNSCLSINNNEDLRKRVAIANEAEADYFVSIHANAYMNDWNTANGWEIYSYTTKGEGYQLAKSIQAASIPYLGLRNRGIKTNVFYVTKNTKMPAVLIEHGFYTNRSECEKLKSDEFREKCAIADAKGILNHLGITWKEESNTITVNGIKSMHKVILNNGKLYMPVEEMAHEMRYDCTIDGNNNVILEDQFKLERSM